MPIESENTANRFVIVGAGIAGVSAAEAIHKALPNADITLISKESALPYFRMNLTRYLAGDLSGDSLNLHKEEWYLQNHITLLLNTTVVDLLPEQKLVVLDGGKEISYDRLILATGATPFVPPFPGSDLDGVQTLRTIEDANHILEVCHQGVTVVCIGGGLLGLEVAGAIARSGAHVSVVESLDWLLPRQLDEAASQILQKKIEAMGIEIIVGAKTKAIVGDGKVEAVLLDDGRSLPAEMVSISTGVSANLDLARKAGLEIGHGIVVDEQMRTSRADIFAAGDDTEYHGRMYGLWVPAKTQGSIAGQCAAGEKASFAGDPPSARLKVLGIDMFSIGEFAPRQAADVKLAKATDDTYTSFLFRDGLLIGSILLGDASLAAAVKGAVEDQRDFSALLGQSADARQIEAALRA